MTTQFLVITLDPQLQKCSYCSNAKKLLTKRNKEYHEMYITNEATKDALNDLGVDASILKTFPQIYDLTKESGKELIGGFTELMQYLNK